MPQHQISLISLSGRLKLVLPSARDNEFVAVLRSHAVTRRYLRFEPEHYSTKDAAVRREKSAEDECSINFHVHLQKGDGTSVFVGLVVIHDIDKVHDYGEIGILISPNYHRGGLATEALHTLLTFAFEEKKLHRCTFVTSADNVMMQGWLEHVAGAKQEYRMKECFKDAPGKYSDAVVYAILDQEWTGAMKAKLEERLDLAKGHLSNTKEFVS